MQDTEEPRKFIHLHVHSEYSLMDGTIRIKDLVQEAKNRGHSHVALTDHANMHGAVAFYMKAKEEGITPIVGCEIFHAHSNLLEKLSKEEEWEYPEIGAFHLVLLAKNTQGYKHLMKIVSSGYLGDSFKEMPITPRSMFFQYGDQLIVLSGCLKGEFGFLVQKLRQSQGSEKSLFEDLNEKSRNIYAALESHVKEMLAAFGESNYFVELMDNGLPEQKSLIEDLVGCARHFSLPIVATADAHYQEKDFADIHSLAVAIKNGLTLGHIKDRLQNTHFHLCTDAEMIELFARYPEAIANTVKIAEQCSGLEIKMDTYYLPKIDLGTTESPTEALIRLAHEGLEERFPFIATFYEGSFDEEKKKVYKERLEFELKVIIQMGFPDYFLIVQDFINWAKRRGIPVGPGRGSGAGSLVAYALKITDLDPIPYNLIFERFLNPSRVSMPDFDVDFCQWRREEVIQYCVNKYGVDQVAQITTFGKLQAKGAVKSVGRAMNISYNKVDQFTKIFPPDLGITIQNALDMEPRLKQEMEKDDLLNECIEAALKIEGLASHTSVHAAGLVISDGPMTDYVPVYTTDGKSLITQYEMKPTEKVGLVKFDFLGLKTLTVISKALQLIKKNLGVTVDLSKISMKDEKVFKLLSDGNTVGIFQCESTGMTQLITKLKPSSFEDIVALVALFRPGPLGSGMVDDFVERKHGRQKISYPHPLLEDILRDTYGMILYQEQVQKIAAVLANYTLGEADLLRRAMGKKIPEEMAKQKTRFLQGSAENKIDAQLAEEIFDLMAEFAKYGFNKSHSAAYGLVSYHTAYLKAHYPEQFMAAIMTCDMDNTDKIIRYCEDCFAMGFKIISPTINYSHLEFDAQNKGEVSFALAAIKGIGEGVLKLMLEERDKNGLFKDFIDLAHRVNLNKVGKKNLQLLAVAGAFDDLGYVRSKLEAVIPEAVDYSVEHFEAKAKGQRSLFAGFAKAKKPSDDHIGAPWEREIRAEHEPQWGWKDLFEEKKLFGIFLSGHPMDYFKRDQHIFGVGGYKDLAKLAAAMPPPKPDQKQSYGRRDSQKVAFVALLSAIQYRRAKKSGNLMAYFRFEFSDGAFEALVFQKQLNELQIPEINTVVQVQANLEPDEQGGFRATVQHVMPLSEVRAERVKGVKLILDAGSFGEDKKFSQLTQLLMNNPGPTPVQFLLNHEGVKLHMSTEGCSVEVRDDFLIHAGSVGADKLQVEYRM